MGDEVTDKWGTGGGVSPTISTLGLGIQMLSFPTHSLSEGRIPPKGTEKPGSLTSFLTSRITVGYFSMVFLILLFFVMEEARAGASFSRSSTSPRKG